jgi:hypothetical protein
MLLVELDCFAGIMKEKKKVNNSAADVHIPSGGTIKSVIKSECHKEG